MAAFAKAAYNRQMLSQKIRSMGYALKGLRIAYLEEHNFRFELLLAAATVCAGWYFELTRTEWLFVVAAIGIVLMAEVFNTALEELCDMLRQTHDPHVAKIKDLSAAGVLIAAWMALIVGLIVFSQHII